MVASYDNMDICAFICIVTWKEGVWTFFSPCHVICNAMPDNEIENISNKCQKSQAPEKEHEERRKKNYTSDMFLKWKPIHWHSCSSVEVQLQLSIHNLKFEFEYCNSLCSHYIRAEKKERDRTQRKMQCVIFEHFQFNHRLW